jgi:hypothetical protein
MTLLNQSSRKAIFFTLAALAITVGVLIGLWPREASYRGKPLNYWLDRLPVFMDSPFNDAAADYLGGCPKVSRTGSPVAHADMVTAVNALSALGPQSLPLLVERLRCKVTRPAMWLFEARLFARKYLGLSGIVSLPPPPFFAARISRDQAIFAIIDLGDRSKPILPAVVSLAKNDSDAGVRASALQVLHHLDPADYYRLASAPVGQRSP